MPNNHYVDKDYSYILFRVHRVLPSSQHWFLREVKYETFERTERISIEEVISGIINKISQIMVRKSSL